MTKKSTRPDAGGGYKRINENLSAILFKKQMVHYTCTNYHSQIKNILDSVDIVFTPFANPDGYEVHHSLKIAVQ